jgi:S-adenosylmethionine:tRNA ribosyltransferase-isomerase
MIVAGQGERSAKLLVADADGGLRNLSRAALAWLFRPGDLIVANDATTLPASLMGTHCASGDAIEIRLAAWESVGDPTRFTAIAFRSGDHRTPTEERIVASLAPDDRLTLGPLVAVVEHCLASRLFKLRFVGERTSILAGLARHARPIQYAHVSEVLALADVWTRIAADPIALEPPSAGFALNWRVQAIWRERGIGFATLTHAAGISSTGDLALDECLPFDEPYRIGEPTATAIAQTKARQRQIVAIGTTVVRALESAAAKDGHVRAGDGVARGRIGRKTPLRVVDALLTGVHQPGDSHFELLRAFADDAALERIAATLRASGYRAHEFGDSLLIARRDPASRADRPP